MFLSCGEVASLDTEDFVTLALSMLISCSLGQNNFSVKLTLF